MSSAVRRSTRISSQVHISRFPPQKRRKLSGAAAASTSLDVVQATAKATKAKSKTTKNTIPEPSEYPRATNDWKFGAHVSTAGGVENAILNAAEIGANAFALFVKSQRKWTSPALTEESIILFRSRMKAFRYDPSHVLPHGSYLINLGNPDAEKRQKSYECFLDDLRRCELLGLTLYNFHPGSTVGIATREESISLIAECLNRAHKETCSVITVIENMAGAGNVIGSKFSEIASIIEQVEDKTRVGVCLDTCHMFAAGYDARTRERYESTLADFDAEIGLRYLRAMHLNDSKTPIGSNRDRHENIGLGYLGLAPFAFIARDPRLKHLPLVLETSITCSPSTTSDPKKVKYESPDIWRTEIRVLNRLSPSVLYPSTLASTSSSAIPGGELHTRASSEDSEVEKIWEGLVKEVEEAVGRKSLAGGSEASEKGKQEKKRALDRSKGDEKGKKRTKRNEIDDEEVACAHE